MPMPISDDMDSIADLPATAPVFIMVIMTMMLNYQSTRYDAWREFALNYGPPDAQAWLDVMHYRAYAVLTPRRHMKPLRSRRTSFQI